MSKKPEPGSPSIVVKMALIGTGFIALYYLNVATQMVSAKITELPVQGKTQVTAPATDIREPAQRGKALHPLLVESSNKAAALRQASAASTANEPVNFDALFGRERAQKDVDARNQKDAAAKELLKPPTPAMAAQSFDAFKDLATQVRVQAVMKDGAVVNGGFFETGAVVTSLPYASQDGTRTLYPVLSSVQDDAVLLAEAGKGTRKIRARLLN